MDSGMMYQCASSDVHIFGAIGCGASSVVHRAIYIPIHRVLALKKINVFEKEKRQQLLNEIRTLCEAPCYQGLVEFPGAFYPPVAGQICIALEYMDGGSLADILRKRKRIPEEYLSSMLQALLQALYYLHKVRHLVHRDIKLTNQLLTLFGELKITDFGLSAGLQDSMAMILYGPSPTPPKDSFSPEFCSFVDVCLQKNPDARPTAEQLLSHPFIKKYKCAEVSLEAYVRSVVGSTQRLEEMADLQAEKAIAKERKKEKKEKHRSEKSKEQKRT